MRILAASPRSNGSDFQCQSNRRNTACSLGSFVSPWDPLSAPGFGFCRRTASRSTPIGVARGSLAQERVCFERRFHRVKMAKDGAEASSSQMQSRRASVELRPLVMVMELGRKRRQHVFGNCPSWLSSIF